MSASLRSRIAVGLLLAVALVACRPPTQSAARVSSVSGRVLDAETLLPLPGVRVESVPSAAFATSNADGQFVLTGPFLSTVTYALLAERSGYQTTTLGGVSVTEGDNTVADLSLRRLGAVLVVGQARLDVSARVDAVALSLQNGGDPKVALSYDVRSSVEWLSLDPPSGEALAEPTTITVRVDRALLGQNWGIYRTQLSITSNGGSAELPVVVQHFDAAPAVVGVEPQLSEFGASDSERVLRLVNDGDSQTSWELVSAPFYLSVPTMGGDLRPGDFVDLPVRLDRRGLPEGSLVAELVFATGSLATPNVSAFFAFDVPAYAEPAVDLTTLDFGSTQTKRALVVENLGNQPLSFDFAWPAPGEAGDFTSCLVTPRIYTVPRAGVLAGGQKQTIEVFVDRSAVAAGPVAEALTLRSSFRGAVLPERTVSVLFEVPPKPMLSLTADRTELTAAFPSATVQLIAAGDPPTFGVCDLQTNVSLDWTLSADEPWLEIDTAQGGFGVLVFGGGYIDASVAPQAVTTVRVNRALLPQPTGTFSATLTATAVGGGESLSRTLDVSFALPPSQIEVVQLSDVVGGVGIGSFGGRATGYDPFRDRVVAYGARISRGSGFDPWRTVERAGSGEVVMYEAGGPFAGLAFPFTSNNMVYDARRGVMVMVAYVRNPGCPTVPSGCPEACGGSMETWEFSGAQWTKITTAAAPSLRCRPSLFVDAERERVLLYGGYTGAPGSTGPRTPLNDLWSYTGSTWTQLEAAVIPGLDVTHGSMTHDPVQDRYVFHGGRLTSLPLSTWGNEGSERGFTIDPVSFAATPLADSLSIDRFGRQLVHNEKTNVTYAYGQCAAGTSGDSCTASFGATTLTPWLQPIPLPPESLGGYLPQEYSDGRIFFDRYRQRVTYAALGPEGQTSSVVKLLVAALVDDREPVTHTLTASALTVALGSRAQNTQVTLPAHWSLSNAGDTWSGYRIANLPGWLRVVKAGANVSSGLLAAPGEPGDSDTFDWHLDTSGLALGSYATGFDVELYGRQKLRVNVTMEVVP